MGLCNDARAQPMEQVLGNEASLNKGHSWQGGDPGGPDLTTNEWDMASVKALLKARSLLQGATTHGRFLAPHACLTPARQPPRAKALLT